MWLQEGLAQYEEAKVRARTFEYLANAVRSSSLFSKDELLHGNVANYSDRMKAVTFHEQALSVATSMIERYRIFRVKEFLDELGKGTPFGAAFEKVFGVSFDDFWVRWRDEVMEKYGKGN